jgi:hypothetical protein
MEQALHRTNFPAAGDLSNDQWPGQRLQGEREQESESAKRIFAGSTEDNIIADEGLI